MPFLITICLACLLLVSCNKPSGEDQSSSKQGKAASSQKKNSKQGNSFGARKRVMAVFSGTETDQWTAAMLGALGSRLEFDPWASADADDYFDYYGPHELQDSSPPLDIWIVLSGMDGISGIERQQAAAQHLLEQAEEWKPDLIWLDGDQLQYSAGRLLLDNDYQIAFSGLQFDSNLYYEAEDNAAGFYRRHSVSGTMGRIWRDNADALIHCIATDDSAEGRRRLIEFTDAEDLLGEGSSLHVLPVFSTWQELEEVIEQMPAEADDLIICAAGIEGSSTELLTTQPPEELLAACRVPVYVLGPSRLDMLGCTSLLVKPSAQVNEMLTVFEANLGKGIPMHRIPTIVPEDMQLQVSEAPDVLSGN